MFKRDNLTIIKQLGYKQIEIACHEHQVAICA